MLTKIFTFSFYNFLALLSITLSCNAAVILQYHHVSDLTPKSTSISPKQFELHLQFLTDHKFNVIALPELVNAIKSQKVLPDKTVVITFDDAYNNVFTQAKPLLDKFNFPYTIFINPKLINSSTDHYLSWQQLAALAKQTDQQVTIANHGLEHNSFARPVKNKNREQGFRKLTQDLLLAETLIEKYTGQSWRFFAYPYGEYTTELQHWLRKNEFTAFTQQSGAVGNFTDLTIVPRFPASHPYDKLDSLKDKLYALPLSMHLINNAISTNSKGMQLRKTQPESNQLSDTRIIAKYGIINQVTFEINNGLTVDENKQLNQFNPKQLNCYVSGLGKQKIEWLNATQFTLKFAKPLPVGRVRSNCTAPSIENSKRFYWFSQPWFILNTDGSWFPL